MGRINQWVALAGFIAICLLAGGLGGWITAQSVSEWYPTLNKPSWNPPSSVFAPVWTTLYLMMAVAAWLVWKKDQHFSGVRVALRESAARSEPAPGSEYPWHHQLVLSRMPGR